jgi:hypothetical protein
VPMPFNLRDNHGARCRLEGINHVN